MILKRRKHHIDLSKINQFWNCCHPPGSVGSQISVMRSWAHSHSLDQVQEPWGLQHPGRLGESPWPPDHHGYHGDAPSLRAWVPLWASGGGILHILCYQYPCLIPTPMGLPLHEEPLSLCLSILGNLSSLRVSLPLSLYTCYPVLG